MKTIKRDAVRIEVGEVTILGINSHDDFGDSLMLQQIRKTFYPNSTGKASDMQDAFFSTDMYGEKEPIESKRIAFFPISGEKFESMTDEEIIEMAQTQLDAAVKAGKEPCIYRRLAMSPIYNSGHASYIKSLKSVKDVQEFHDKVANRQLVRDSDSKVVKYKEQNQYRDLFFKWDWHEDIDTRDAELTPLLEQEGSAEAGVETETNIPTTTVNEGGTTIAQPSRRRTKATA